MEDRRTVAFIPLAALIAISPLIFHGPSCGHDFEFHLRNWLEVGSQWRQGVVLPRWDFTAAWNSGEPRFVFYPPISWVVGALLGLVLPWAAVPIIFIWMALTGCGLTMYRLAREWAPAGNALIAACFYIAHPYMLFTFYERAAYAELLAAAWIPLVLLSVLRARITLAGIAVPICLLWLTNAPAAVMGSYALALFGLVRVVLHWRAARGLGTALREGSTVAAGAGLGIGCAAFYVFPAAVEQSWVHITMPFLRGVRWQDNLLFGAIGDPAHDAILRSASFCGVILLGFAAVAAAIAFYLKPEPLIAGQRGGTDRRVIVSLVVVTCCVAFLLTSPSALLWKHLPKLVFLQFPWRFCAVLGATSAALLALALRWTRIHAVAAVVLGLSLTLALSLGGNSLFRQPCISPFDVAGIVDSFRDGGRYDYTDEYPPAGADGEKLGHTNPGFWLAKSPTDPAPAASGDYSVALNRRLEFTVGTSEPAFVVINLRDYPAWRITANGSTVGARPHREDGLIVVPVRDGVTRIGITYVRAGDSVLGWVVSAASIATLLFVAWYGSRSNDREPALV